MKTYIISIICAILAIATLAQAPQSFTHQAVIRDGNNQLILNSPVGMRTTILQGNPHGTIVYQEIYTPNPQTNAHGLITLEIGSGSVLIGNFVTINWENGPYFIKTEADPSGSTNYTIIETSQLLSVPYALYAKMASVDLNDVLIKNNSANNKKIINLANPEQPQDAATKAYVDGLLTRIEALELLNTGFVDPRDGNHYNAIKIGNQIWMTENLRYLPSVVGPSIGSQVVPYYYVYGYKGTDVNTAKATANYRTFGVLYNWSAAMNGSASSSTNPSEVQGICPTGWHLPSDAEWTELTTYLGGERVAGNKLIETGTIHWFGPNSEATNETGFTALPGGYRSNYSKFLAVGKYGFWWSSLEAGASDAWYRYMYFKDVSLYSNGIYKEYGFSVRCLRD